MLPANLLGQKKSRYNFFSYNVNEGLLQSNVLDIAFDQNNFCWLSFTNGIQKFNGNRFVDIPVQKGLPDDKGSIFFRQKNGSLLIIHSLGISRYNIHKDEFELIYRKPASFGRKLMILGENNKKLYLFNEKADIITIDEDSYRVLDSLASGLPTFKSNQADQAYTSNVLNNKVLIYIDDYLYQWDLSANKLTDRSEKLPGISNSFIGHFKEGEAVFFAIGNGVVLSEYNFKTKKLTALFEKDIDNTRAFRGIVAHWNNKTILSYFNQLYEMSAGMTSVEAAMIDFRNNYILGNSSVSKTGTDNFDNLFLVTINDGIRKITRSNYPIRYFAGSKAEDKYIISVYADKANNNILAGTYGQGLLVFDSLQNIRKHIPFLPGSKQKFSVNSIVQNAAGDYIIMVPASPAYLLSKDLKTLKPLPVKNMDGTVSEVKGYFGSLVTQNAARAILQSDHDIYLLNKITNEIFTRRISAFIIHSSVLFGNSLVFHSNDELYFLDTINFKTSKKIPFPNTAGVRCYLTGNGKIYLGSNKGIFIINADGKILQQYNKTNGLPDECIYSMNFDGANNLWCSSNKGIFKISPDGSLLQLTRQDGLQENEFNTNAAYKTPDGELFFGGINGVNSFYPEAIPDYMTDVTIYLNQVKVNNQPYKTDTATWNIRKMVLPYDQNALSLEFVASGPQNSGQYVHQYKMEGIDKEWIQNEGMQPARYVLPPGTYVFKMYASSYFDKNAVALKEVLIIIKPPFYKAWWFILLMSLFTILLVIYFVNLYNRTRYRKSMAILMTQQKVQEERERISMELHDSIGAYANAVLYNTELLEAEKEEPVKIRLMKDLRFASKDIITALRETIWAFKGNSFSAQDCMLRIRNFVHPFSRYYPAINFKIEGDAPAGKPLPNASALSIVRIVQESVNNAIKHSNPGNITVLSEVSGAEWILTIKDDGAGFDIKTIDRGNGLINMKKRADELGFYLNITSEKGKGTTVIIKI
jgi:signal transduction histidine kinase